MKVKELMQILSLLDPKVEVQIQARIAKGCLIEPDDIEEVLDTYKRPEEGKKKERVILIRGTD